MKISVGICAYNEEKNIGRLLENIIQQPLNPPFILGEILVISSGSVDGTNKIVKKMKEKDKRIKLVTEKERNGKAHAINYLLKTVEGDLLVVISADTKPSFGSLKTLVTSVEDNIGGSCARTVPMNKNHSIMNFCNRFLWEVHNKLLLKESKNGSLGHLGGDMWVVRRGIIDQIPENIINDDAYLGIMIKKMGWRILFITEAKVLISSPRNPKEYVQQRERIIIGHKQLEEVTGTKPTTVGALAFKNPIFSFKFLLKESILYDAKDYPKIILSILLETIAQISAKIHYKDKKDFLKWKQIYGTKMID